MNTYTGKRSSTSNTAYRSGAAEQRNQDSWKKWGEGFEGIPLEGSSNQRTSIIGRPLVEEKDIEIFSSDSDEEVTNKIRSLIPRTSRKRKRESKSKPAKQLFAPRSHVPENDDFKIDTFSPSKLSGNSSRLSQRISQKGVEDIIETFSPSKLSKKDLECESLQENGDGECIIEAHGQDPCGGEHSLPNSKDSDVLRSSGTGDILDYNSEDDLDSRLCEGDPTEINEQHENPGAKFGTSCIAPSRAVFQKLKIDAALEIEDPSRIDDPSPRKRSKYIKGQLADRLSKLLTRESSDVAFWRHKLSKKGFKEDSTKNMMLEVQNLRTSLTLTFVKCKVLEDNREDGIKERSVVALFNKEQATSLKVGKSQVLRIHPPWQEINMSTGETMLLCGKFCQVVKPAESAKSKLQCSILDDGSASDDVTHRWVYHFLGVNNQS